MIELKRIFYLFTWHDLEVVEDNFVQHRQQTIFLYHLTYNQFVEQQNSNMFSIQFPIRSPQTKTKIKLEFNYQKLYSNYL